MAFVVVAIALEVLPFLQPANRAFQQREQADNKPFYYKLNNILTFWKPLTEPKRNGRHGDLRQKQST